MSASPSVEDRFTFVEGLNTEGSFFLTPKNAWKEGDNVVPDTQGTVARRKALDFEAGFGGTYDAFVPGALTRVIDPGVPGYAMATGDYRFWDVQGTWYAESYAGGPISPSLYQNWGADWNAGYHGGAYYSVSDNSVDIYTTGYNPTAPWLTDKYYHIKHTAKAGQGLGTELDFDFVGQDTNITPEQWYLNVTGTTVTFWHFITVWVAVCTATCTIPATWDNTTLEGIVNLRTGEATIWQDGVKIGGPFTSPSYDTNWNPGLHKMIMHNEDGAPVYDQKAISVAGELSLNNSPTPTSWGGVPPTYGPWIEEYYASDVSGDAYTIGMWEAVNGNGDNSFMVVQYGHIVLFVDTGVDPLTTGIKDFYIDLGHYQAHLNNEVIGRAPITVASCYGKLVITSKDTDPLLVTYDDNTDTISVRRLSLKVRDFNGFRSPKQPQVEHTEAEWTALNFWPHALYNLYNQGWTDTKLSTFVSGHSSKYPANTKQWVYGKDASDNYSNTVLDKQDFGTTPAPRGKFILDAFYMDRAAAVLQAEDTTAQVSVEPAEPCNDLTFTWP